MLPRLKAFSFVSATWLLGALGSAAAIAQGPAPASASVELLPSNPADEQAIRATADEFVKAFNAGDAKTIGLEWSDDAQYTDETGQEYHGRAAIEDEYAQLFKEHPGATISVDIESIRFLGPDIAIEKGVARAKLPNGDPDMASHYTVVHARRDGKWVMVVGRDAPYVSSMDGDYLKGLEWLIGQWKTGTAGQELRIKFEWIADRNFIRNTYTIVKDGKSKLTGGQIIGWDPRLGKIVSWHFDASGGFGNDVWTKEDAKWVIRATGTLRDGSDSAATNIITPIDANTFTWQSDQRTLDGVSLPDTGPVKITRADTNE
jgi:uncharacterized protein (TIGR02246 family)